MSRMAFRQLLQNFKELTELFDNELLLQYAKVGDHEVIQILESRTVEMLDYICQDYETVKDLEYLSEHIQQMVTIFDMNNEKIMLKLEVRVFIIQANIKLLWKPLTYKNQNETQFGYMQRIFNLIHARNPKLIRESINCIQLFPYIGSTSILMIIVNILQSGESAIEMLTKGFNQFMVLDDCQVINFTYIVHESMTNWQKEDEVDVILQNTATMFAVLKAEDNLSFIAVKNAAHILSLISNYYSLTMQNIDMDDVQKQEQFEATLFYNTLTKNLHIICLLFKKNIMTVVRMKLVEIVENLVRISHLNLWYRMKSLRIFESLLDLIKAYPHADIFLAYVERLFLYIFDRALNDFNPYWALTLCVDVHLYDLRISPIDRHLLWFDSALQETLLQEGELLKYHQELRNIETQIIFSSPWKTAKRHLSKQEHLNQIKLGEHLDPIDPSEPPIIVSAIDVHADESDIQPYQNIFIKCQVDDEAEILRRADSEGDKDVLHDSISPTNIKLPSGRSQQTIPKVSFSQPIILMKEIEEEVESIPVAKISNRLNDFFKQLDEEKSSDHIIEEPNSLKLKYQCLSSSLNETHTSPTIEKLSASYSGGERKITQYHQRRNSQQGSTQLKQYIKNNEEFEISTVDDKKVLKNSEHEILKVDELDYPKRQHLQLLFSKSKGQSTLQIQAKEQESGQKTSPRANSDDDKQYRKMHRKDKQFLSYLESQIK